MAQGRRELPELHRSLLEAAIRSRNGKIWMPRDTADTLSTIYSALVSLQRRKLIEPDRSKDPNALRWKITKAGRELVAPPRRRRAQ